MTPGLAGGVVLSLPFLLSTLGEAWTVILCSKPTGRQEEKNVVDRNQFSFAHTQRAADRKELQYKMNKKSHR